MSETQPLEYPLRQRANHRHDQPESPAAIDDIAATLHIRPNDLVRHALWLICKRSGQLQVRGHERADKPWLDGHDTDLAGKGHAIAQTREILRKAGLGRTIVIVRGASAIAGDRADPDN